MDIFWDFVRTLLTICGISVVFVLTLLIVTGCVGLCIEMIQWIKYITRDCL